MMNNNNLHINWVNGMKINKSHFVQNDAVRQFMINESNRIFLKSYNYGLLPHANTASIPQLAIKDDSLILNYCTAITKNGLLVNIELNEQIKLLLEYQKPNTEDQDSSYYVVINCDPYVRNPFGDPDPAVLPPRQPYSVPTNTLSLVPVASIHTDDVANRHIIVGKIDRHQDRYIIDQDYIPPCHQVIAHKVLLEQYEGMESDIRAITSHAIQVAQKARSKKRRGEINDLAENTYYIMEKLAFYLSQHIESINMIKKEEAPIHLFAILRNLGRCLIVTLKCMKNEDREALLRYYESHIGFQPHQFEGEIKALSQLEYDHLHCSETFNKAQIYIDTLSMFTNKALSLEYHSVERVDVLTETTVKKNKLDIF